MRTIAVIPARFRSNRLPGKPLADIHGKPMVEHVYQRATEAGRVDRVVVATDDERIFTVVRDFGGEAVMTDPDHPSGTDRIAEAVADEAVDLVVNVQGDEPFLSPEAIDAAVACAERHAGAIASLRSVIRSRRDLWDPNVVKVVTDQRDFALYFSRSPIPVAPLSSGVSGHDISSDDDLPAETYFKHVGLYVYPKPILIRLTEMPPSPLEQLERLEQLRALEGGIPICVPRTNTDSISVDTPEDLDRVRSLYAASLTGLEPLANQHVFTNEKE